MNSTFPSGMASSLQQQIQSELQPGERVRWSARPTVGPGAAIMSWGLFVFAIPWTAFAIFWTVGASGILRHSGSPGLIGSIFPLFGLPFIGVGLWMLSTPWRAKKKIQIMADSTAYVITDRRAIVFDSGIATMGRAAGMVAFMPKYIKAAGVPGESMRIQSFPPEKLQDMVRVQHSDGTGDILFSETTVPVYDHEHHRNHMTTQSIGFKCITNAQDVERQLKDLARSAAADGDAPPVLGG